MNKNLLSRTILSLLIMSFVASCDEDGGRAEGDPQNPIQSYVSKLNLFKAAVNEGDYEFGSFLEFKKDGKITSLCLKLPSDGTYDVTLWDLTDSTIVASRSIAVDSGQITYESISALEVMAGDRFAVTVNSDDWYDYRNELNSSLYPRTEGDVVILGYGYFTGSSTSFPDNFPNNYYAGISDVVFIPYED